MTETPGAPNRRIHWWHGLLFFFVALAAQLIIVVLVGIGKALGLLGDTPLEMVEALLSPTFIGIQVIVTCSLLTALALGIPKAISGSYLPWLRINRAPRPAPYALLAVSVIGIIGLGFLIDEVTFLLHSAAPQLFDATGLMAFNKVFESASLAGFVGLTLVVTIGPAIGEEFFFRGFVLRAFCTDMSAWSAVLLSSLLFGAMHLNLLQGTGAGLIGLYLGFIAIRTGSIWPSVIAHLVNNLLCALFARFDQQHIGQAWNEGHGLPILIAATLVTVIAVFVLVRLTEKRIIE